MSITSRINEIETHLKEDYTNLEALGYDIPQDKNIENIASVLDNVWENQSHIEETGTTLSMNTNKGKAKVDLLGNTYQETTTGKNLLQYTLASLKSINAGSGSSWNNNAYTWNGITFTINDDLSVNVNGTATGATYLILNNNLSLTSGTEYILNGCPRGGNASTYALRIYTGSSYESEIGNGKTFTYSSQDLMRINVFNGVTISNLTFYPMIRLSSVSDATYEKPTFGASPNPSYPQPIHVVSGDNTITSTGKNLLNRTTCEENKLIRWVQGDTYSETGSLASDYIKVNIGDSIYANYNYQKMFYDINKNYIGALQNDGSVSTNSNGNMSSNFVVPNVNGIAYIRLGFRTSSNPNIDLLTANIMVNKGTTLETYEPYQSQSYNVNLGVVNLANYQDIPNAPQWASYDGSKYVELSVKPNTQYTMSSNVPYNQNGQLYFNSGSDRVYVGHPVTTTSDSNGKIFFGAFRTRDYYDDIINGTYYIQIEEGTKANSYTPYGTNPIELCIIGTYQDKFIRNSGKNLASGLRLGFYAEATGEYTYNANYGCSISPVNVISGSTYRFSINGTYSTAYIYPYDKNGNYLGRTGTNSYGVYQPSSDVAYFNYLFGNGTISTIPLDSNIQIELGAEITPYEPYGNGDWYLEKFVKEITLDSTKNWSYTSVTQGSLFRSNNSILDETKDRTYVPLSNYYVGIIENDYLNRQNNQLYIQSTSNFLDIIDNRYTSAEDFTTWLSTHNISVYYVLATPTYTKIEGTLASQLEDVWRANTYDNQTNVSQVNNDLPFELYFKALGTPSNVSLLSMNRPSLQLNQIEEEPIEEIEESGDLDGENQENI